MERWESRHPRAMVSGSCRVAVPTCLAAAAAWAYVVSPHGAGAVLLSP